MNKKFACVAVLAMLVAGSGLALDASAAGFMKVSVPFEFSFSGTVFPAGDYEFEVRSLGLAMPTGSAVMIRSLNGELSHLVLTRRGAGSAEPGDWLLFNRYGDSYFLAAVNSNAVTANVSKTAQEKELALKGFETPTDAAAGSKIMIAASVR